MGEVADEAPVVQGLGGRAHDEVPAVDPHHHGQGSQQRGTEVDVQGYKDVEIQTVLAHLWGTNNESTASTRARSL